MAISPFPKRLLFRAPVLLVALLALIPPPLASAKPPPPPPPEPTKVPSETLDAFRRGYKAAGRPKILFLVGIDRRAEGAPPAAGDGNKAAGAVNGPGIGGNLATFDHTGITEVLENGIGAIINEDGQVRMVDLEALSDKDKREIAQLKQNDEDGAIDSMARRINADFVLYIKFTPTPAGARGVNNVAYRCISEVKNVVTATKMPLIPFDWDGPIDNQNSLRYAGALSEVFCQRFVKLLKAPHSITVKILQLPDSAPAPAIRKIIRKIDGVDGNVEVSAGKSSTGGNEATFEFELDGDIADFQEAFEKKLGTDMSLKLSVVGQDKNNITLSVAAGPGDMVRPPPGVPDWYLITDPKDNAVKDRFLAAYKKNPLKVAMIINWLVSPEQLGVQAPASAPLIVMQGDPRINNLPLGPASIELERLSSQITPMFSDLGVQVVNASKVRSILDAQGEKAKSLHNDRELAMLLGSANACDVVCLGLATEIGRKPGELPCDFKLTNCNNGDLVGALTWPVDERILNASPRNKQLLIQPENRTRYIAGQMLLAIERAAGVGKVMTAEFRHAKDLATVQRLAEALKTLQDVTTDGARFDNGVGTFTIRYSGSYEDFIPHLNRIVESQQTLKVVEVNPSSVRVDAKVE